MTFWFKLRQGHWRERNTETVLLVHIPYRIVVCDLEPTGSST